MLEWYFFLHAAITFINIIIVVITLVWRSDAIYIQFGLDSVHLACICTNLNYKILKTFAVRNSFLYGFLSS